MSPEKEVILPNTVFELKYQIFPGSCWPALKILDLLAPWLCELIPLKLKQKNTLSVSIHAYKYNCSYFFGKSWLIQTLRVLMSSLQHLDPANLTSKNIPELFTWKVFLSWVSVTCNQWPHVRREQQAHTRWVLSQRQAQGSLCTIVLGLERHIEALRRQRQWRWNRRALWPQSTGSDCKRQPGEEVKGQMM